MKLMKLEHVASAKLQLPGRRFQVRCIVLDFVSDLILQEPKAWPSKSPVKVN